jgi:hypothetical protein
MVRRVPRKNRIYTRHVISRLTKTSGLSETLTVLSSKSVPFGGGRLLFFVEYRCGGRGGIMRMCVGMSASTFHTPNLVIGTSALPECI